MHIYSQYSVVDDIDYHETNLPLKYDLEKICNLKLPFSIINYENIDTQSHTNYLKPNLNYYESSNTVDLNNELTKDRKTKLNFNTEHRNYFHIKDNNISVKLFPSKTKSYFDDAKNSENIWDNKFPDTIKHLKINLKKNHLLYIPPYWFYSFFNGSSLEKENNGGLKESSLEKENNGGLKESPLEKKNNGGLKESPLENINFITYPNFIANKLIEYKSQLINIYNSY